MERRRLWIIILIIVAALAAGTLALLLNISEEVVYEDVTAKLFFGSLSEDEAARLLEISRAALESGDDERALAVVTYAFTRHDDDLNDELMLHWCRVLLETGRYPDAVEVAGRLIDEQPACSVLSEDQLGPLLYEHLVAIDADDPGFDYALAVALRGLTEQADSAALAEFDALIDARLAESHNLEWDYKYSGEMEYFNPGTARSDVGAAEHQAETRSPEHFAAELSALLNLGPPPGEDEPIVSEPRLAEFLVLTDRISVEVAGTEVEEVESEEEESTEEAEESTAEETDGESDDWLTEHLDESMTEEEAALLREVLSQTPTPEEQTTYRAVTTVHCRLEGFQALELLEHLGLDPHTGRPRLPGDLE